MFLGVLSAIYDVGPIYVKIKLKIDGQKWGDQLNVLFKLCIFHKLCK